MKPKNKKFVEVHKRRSIRKNKNSFKSIDFVNKMKYNEYTNIDKLIYQIN